MEMRKGKAKKVKGVEIGFLPAKTQAAYVEHSRHHTKKHIEAMVRAQKRGATFGEAHRRVQQRIGK